MIDKLGDALKALDWLLHETMYKDHPAASENAMRVLRENKDTYYSNNLFGLKVS